MASHAKTAKMLDGPDIERAFTAVREGLQKRNTILIAGKCTVDYMGRASSGLKLGDRIIIVKEDGAVLVHRSTGYEPVNWMPGGNSILKTRMVHDNLELQAIRQKPNESIRILFEKIYFVSIMDLEDYAEFSLHASEEDMHKAILLRPELVEKELTLISYEKKVRPGFVDVYAVDKEGKMVVIEVKRKRATKEAVFQLAKYISAVKAKADRGVRGILVAPEIGKDVQRTLVSLGLEFKPLDPKKCAEIVRQAETHKLADFFKEI